MPRILVVDNYDSFVYTIVGYLNQLGAQTHVVRNDAVPPAEQWKYDGVLVSPGPGAPGDAGQSVETILECAQRNIPMLGVCLGHQALAEAFGARTARAPELMHGQTSLVTHNGSDLFDGLPQPLTATRYHSLAVEAATVPSELEITAHTANGIVMALAHRELPLYGVQFHPESILTEAGHRLFANWLLQTGARDAVELSLSLAPRIH